MSKKTVMSLDVNCLKCKKEALKVIAEVKGVDDVSINMEENTLTVIGDADPVLLTRRIRKKFKNAQLVATQPAKEEKKKSEETPQTMYESSPNYYITRTHEVVYVWNGDQNPNGCCIS
eukprot:Gb_15541 [translate_table: standard]